MNFYRWPYRWSSAIVFSVMISGCGARVVVPRAPDFGSSSGATNAQIERPDVEEPAPEEPDSSADGTIDSRATDPSNADPAPTGPSAIDPSAFPVPHSGVPVVLDPPGAESPVTVPAMAPVGFASPRPVEVVEKPAPENTGPVSIVIDAPVGSTTRYRFDGDDPVDSGLSFDLSPVSPGEHGLEVEVLIPGAPSEHFEFRWTQVADSEPDADSDTDPGTDDSGAKKQKKHEGKDHHDPHGRSDGDPHGHKKDQHDQRWHKDREKHQPEDKGKRDERKLHDKSVGRAE